MTELHSQSATAALPDTPEGCRARLATLQSEIAAIRVQIATHDLRRQAHKQALDADWFHRAKNLSHVELQLSGISRSSSIRVWYRPDHYPKWTQLGSREFNVASGGPQVRTRVRFSVNPSTMSGCNEATKEAFHIGHAFQFRIEWTGRLKIDRFVVAAPVLDEAPRPQCQVDNAALAAYPEEEFLDFQYEVPL